MGKGKNTSSVEPIVHKSHKQEDDSRIIFQKCIKPWMIVNWFNRDYGIDANIEIQKALNDTSHDIGTGRRFSLQLKSSDKFAFERRGLSLPVSKSKITYWHSSIEPVMLAYVDLEKELIYYVWIDDGFIQNLNVKNPNWLAQETVTIKFSSKKVVCSDELANIERYVLRWKRSSKSILTPGNYFRYSQEAAIIVEQLTGSVRRHKIESLGEDLETLRNDSERSIYTIAIVGPSRVGKSTLINSLLYKEVSPVDVLPTTGIPISIFPFNENKTTVLFKNNTKITGNVDAAFLNEYTSQKGNPKNKKNVKYVSVNIINKMLEKGLSLCDVPGLDDPDPIIRNITQAAVHNVNAIVYVISVASYTNGEFSITKSIVEDLTRLGSLMDRVFIVFNKIDSLTASQLDDIKAYINEQLEYYEILKYLPCEPVYISSKDSFDKRVNKIVGGSDSVQQLEKEIWTYLLAHSKTGLHRILITLGNSKSLVDKHKNIVNSRLLDSRKRVELENEISLVELELSEIKQQISHIKPIVSEQLKNYTHNSFTNVLSHLRMQLNSIAITDNLPPKERIIKFLEDNAYKIITDVNNKFQTYVFRVQSEINVWVAGKLKQVEVVIHDDIGGVETQTLDVAKYTNQIFSFFQEKSGGYIGILESFVGGIISAIEYVFHAIENVFLSKETIRESDIKEMLAKATTGYDKIETDFSKSITDYLNVVCQRIEHKTLDRANVYLGELRKQVQQLKIPLEVQQQQNLQSFLHDINNISRSIDSAINHLQDYTDSIEWQN